MNTLPTSDAVLDALAKAIHAGAQIVWCGCPVIFDHTSTMVSSYNATSAKQREFPATHEGLTQALLFAGLRIEGGNNATA